MSCPGAHGRFNDRELPRNRTPPCETNVVMGDSGDLDKCIDGHNGEVRLTFGIIDEIKVDELLQLHVWCLE